MYTVRILKTLGQVSRWVFRIRFHFFLLFVNAVVFVITGEHQILKNEVKRLRTDLSNSTNGKLRMCFGLKSPAEAGTLEAMQMALDMKNLNLY